MIEAASNLFGPFIQDLLFAFLATDDYSLNGFHGSRCSHFFHPEPSGWLEGVTAGERSTPGAEFDATSGVPDRIQIHIRTDGGVIGGTVQHKDAPFADALVTLVVNQPPSQAAIELKQ